MRRETLRYIYGTLIEELLGNNLGQQFMLNHKEIDDDLSVSCYGKSSKFLSRLTGVHKQISALDICRKLVRAMDAKKLNSIAEKRKLREELLNIFDNDKTVDDIILKIFVIYEGIFAEEKRFGRATTTEYINDRPIPYVERASRKRLEDDDYFTVLLSGQPVTYKTVHKLGRTCVERIDPDSVTDVETRVPYTEQGYGRNTSNNRGKTWEEAIVVEQKDVDTNDPSYIIVKK